MPEDGHTKNILVELDGGRAVRNLEDPMEETRHVDLAERKRVLCACVSDFGTLQNPSQKLASLEES